MKTSFVFLVESRLYLRAEQTEETKCAVTISRTQRIIEIHQARMNRKNVLFSKDTFGQEWKLQFMKDLRNRNPMRN